MESSMNPRIIDLLEHNGNQFIQHIKISTSLMKKYISHIFEPYYYIQLTIMYDNVILGEIEFRLEERQLIKLFNN